MSWIRALGHSQGSLVGAEGEGRGLFSLFCSKPGAGASNFPALSDGDRNHQVSRKDREPPTQLLMGTLSCSRKYKVMVSDKIENVIMTDGTNRQE